MTAQSMGMPTGTSLSDDEALFRESVADLAAAEVRPRVKQMEANGKIDPALTASFFEAGLMGIEIPESHGGSAGLWRW